MAEYAPLGHEKYHKSPLLLRARKNWLPIASGIWLVLSIYPVITFIFGSPSDPAVRSFTNLQRTMQRGTYTNKRSTPAADLQAQSPRLLSYHPSAQHLYLAHLIQRDPSDYLTASMGSKISNNPTVVTSTHSTYMDLSSHYAKTKNR